MKIKIISIIAGSVVLAGIIFFIAQKGEVVTVESANQSGEGSEDIKIENEVALAEEPIMEEELKKEPESLQESKEIDKSSDNSLEEDNSISKEEAVGEKNERDSKIIDKKVAWGFASAKDRKIDTIILHTSYNILGGDEYSVEKVIEEYRQYQVTPHYLIDREGSVFQLVDDKNVAYHAGESQVPDGRTGVNNFSLGIEVINSEKDKFTESQYKSINFLLGDLKKKYKIKYILGHNDIAPGRKTDPWNIDWDKVKR
ncbi:MAG: N-acetylmuramoyl-L-alanine amidase [Candidatus Moraniibacteriota bacterium]